MRLVRAFAKLGNLLRSLAARMIPHWYRPMGAGRVVCRAHAFPVHLGLGARIQRQIVLQDHALGAPFVKRQHAGTRNQHHKQIHQPFHREIIAQSVLGHNTDAIRTSLTEAQKC